MSIHPYRLALPALTIAVLAAAGCSTDDATSTSPPPSTTSPAATTPAATTSAAAATSAPAVTAAPESDDPQPTTAGGPDRCHTSELTGSLSMGDAAAGNRYATLTLTNTGGEVCTVYGYGGLGLVGRGGTSVPSQQVRVPATDGSAASRTTLQPGQSVSATLHWGAVATGPEPTSGDCEPTPAALSVIPPNETDALTVPWTYGPVCDFGSIDQTPYQAA